VNPFDSNRAETALVLAFYPFALCTAFSSGLSFIALTLGAWLRRCLQKTQQELVALLAAVIGLVWPVHSSTYHDQHCTE
jgi:ABC-type Fe3+-siderophore transport system permease subunit